MPRLVLSAAILTLAPTLAPAEPVSQPGEVVAVTVYQGQALVTREVALESVDGLAEIVVTDLPAQVTPGSLYAEPIGDVEIRSVRYRVRPVAEDTREEVRELDGQIRDLNDELAAVNARGELLNSRAGYLQKLEDFTTKTASHELTSGVLDATTLKELTKTIFDGREEVAQGRLEIEKASRDLRQRIALLGKKRQQLTSSSSRSMREAVVFVNAPQAGAARIRLTYLVSGASWSPSYNLRASDARDQVVVEYNASVRQQSGEDWTDVAMTLSTASPSLVAAAPSLDPMPIRLGAAPTSASGPRGAVQSYEESRQQLAQQQKSLSKTRRSFAANEPASGLEDLFSADVSQQQVEDEEYSAWFGRGMGGGGGFGAAYGDFGALVDRTDRGLNTLGCAMQLLDWNSEASTAGLRRPQASGADGVSVEYNLANRTSLPSRSDQQLIRIASLQLEGEFYRVARPLLTEYVYEEASVQNESEFVLLAGPAATFLGDRFVGRGAVPTVSVGEAFTIGLGIDESLRASRELMLKDRRMQGGNRVVRFDYRLVIENFGDAPADVRLFDRLPTADDAEIKVSLLDSSKPVFDGDPKLRKHGMLRWDVSAPANGAAAGTVAVDYAMQLEYDKNRTIVQATAQR